MNKPSKVSCRMLKNSIFRFLIPKDGVQSLNKLVTFCILCFLPSVISAQITIAFETNNEPIHFGVNHIVEALNQVGQNVQIKDRNESGNKANIVVRVQNPDNRLSSIQDEGFKIFYQEETLYISALDDTGAMYGALEVAEQILMGKSWKNITTKKVNPNFTVRAQKFNLPWSSYRVGEVMDQHLEVAKDLKFWQKYIDQMAKNRFNVLSLWNVHPFSYMVKPTNFPGANNFSDKEMNDWKHFYTSLFRMCRDRGIQPFIVNWNIAVSPEFAEEYGVLERNDTSEIVKTYTKEVVTQVINEYPDLAGIGITLADWMSNFNSENSSLPSMTPQDREDWIEQTVVAGIKEANRPVKFLHRSVLSADPLAMRDVISNAKLPDTALVEVKFNWSHGHSTPILVATHDSHSGKIDKAYWEPLPTDFRIQWMVRNEDFFILRWGQPDFIREHIKINSAPYVNGYFIGSEGYIPAKDVSHISNEHKTWDYAFEKQWLFYMLWGRLLYDPTTPNSVFEAEFNNRYKTNQGKKLLKAYAAASKMPLRLASFYGATWDYTLYSEGFLAPFASNGGKHDSISSFISIDELISQPTLDPNYISISDFVELEKELLEMAPGKVTPLMLAQNLEADSKKIFNTIKKLRSESSSTLSCELDDLEAWGYLSNYFAAKLKAGVALQRYRTTGKKDQQNMAILLLEKSVDDWKRISEVTSNHYREVPYIDDHSKNNGSYKDANTFGWSKYLVQVERDIDLAKKPRFEN